MIWDFVIGLAFRSFPGVRTSFSGPISVSALACCPDSMYNMHLQKVKKFMEENLNQRRIRTAFLCSMGVIAFFLGFIPVILGYAAKSLYQLPMWLQLLILTFPLQIAYLCAVIIPAKKIQPEVPLREQLDLALPRNRLKTFWLVTGGVVILYPCLSVVTLLNRKLLALLHIKAATQELVTLIGSADLPSVLVILSAAVLLAPPGEELVFRHAIYQQFVRISRPAGAACVSALLFALSHFNALTFPALFLLALFLQFVYVRTKSLTCAIYAHILYNAISVILLLLLRFGVL